MGNFIAIYKMLKILELSLDLKESSIECTGSGWLYGADHYRTSINNRARSEMEKRQE